MAIKKRRPAVDPAAIEAFGAAADQPVVSESVQSAPAPAPEPAPVPAAPKATAAKGWPDGVPRSHLVRWPDPELARLLAEVAALEDRSQQRTALRALRRGLEAIRADHQV